MPDFTGKVALVTGGASGIGRATALGFARAGANIAGVVHAGGMFCAPAERERALAVNLHGVIHSVLAQATLMKPAGSGAIVNVSSIAGIQGSSVSTYYSTAKHAVIGFTKSVALELAPHGIRVNAICPGFTATPMTASRFGDGLEKAGAQFTPLGRIGQPRTRQTPSSGSARRRRRSSPAPSCPWMARFPPARKPISG